MARRSSPIDGKICWASKVPRNKIRRLYQLDARGIIDMEKIDEVGWALWERCESILAVTAAHHGHILCPACNKIIECQDHWTEGYIVKCAACGWQTSWKVYHQSYRGKQLFGANAVALFSDYHKTFPLAQDAHQKMLLIDQLIHAFYIGLTEVGRPVAANLIEGTLREVIQFLDALTNTSASGAGIINSHDEWRRTLETATWSKEFLNGDSNCLEEPN